MLVMKIDMPTPGVIEEQNKTLIYISITPKAKEMPAMALVARWWACGCKFELNPVSVIR